MPELIPDSPENIARAILAGPPKNEWDYLKEHAKKRYNIGMESDPRLAIMILARIEKYFARYAEGNPITASELVAGIDTRAALIECLHLRDDGYIEVSPVVTTGAQESQRLVNAYIEDVSLMNITGITAKGQRKLEKEYGQLFNKSKPTPPPPAPRPEIETRGGRAGEFKTR